MNSIAVRAVARVSHLKAFGLVASFMVGQPWLVAGAPATVNGLVYSESSFSAIVGDRISRSRLLLLQSDGRLVGLYASVEGLRVPLRASIPPDDTWSYRRTGDTSAELTIGAQTVQLTFTSDTAGTIPAGDVFTRISFTLTPYAGTAQLANSSNRSFVRNGSSAFTGFVVANGSRRILVRAIGPTLRTFGITEFLRQPTLRVSRAATNQTVATNAGWSGAELATVQQRAGAFPLPEGSGDCAVFLSLEAGAYVAEVSSTDPTDSGQVLIEVYALL